MHATGDYIEATQAFGADFWGPRTALFVKHLAEDFSERHWDGIFRGLAAMSVKVIAEAAVEKGIPRTPAKHVPLPPSDPPSPPAQD